MLESIQKQSEDDQIKKALAESTAAEDDAIKKALAESTAAEDDAIKKALAESTAVEDDAIKKALAESNTAITEEEQLTQALQMSMGMEAGGAAVGVGGMQVDGGGGDLAKALAMSREAAGGMPSEEEQMRKAVEMSMGEFGGPSNFGGMAVDDFGGAAHFGGGTIDDAELAQVLALSMEEHAAAHGK
jgi:hypothetical protein